MDSVIDRWLTIRRWLERDLVGGPRVPMAWIINVQKGGTMPFVLLLMVLSGNWSLSAWTYLALHGTYGLCWLLKDRVFPDPNFDQPVTLPSAFVAWAAVLGPYWVIAALAVLRPLPDDVPLMAGATILHTLGVVIMMGADTQKFFVLRARKGLITDGWFARIRHPNYLGEMMLYASFALLARHPAAWVILLAVWSLVFAPNMWAKERSMARYPEWAAYRARTGLLLPKIL
jgi:protein-S-isoprenylcysteine O-methyltransferase Ste14